MRLALSVERSTLSNAQQRSALCCMLALADCHPFNNVVALCCAAWRGVAWRCVALFCRIYIYLVYISSYIDELKICIYVSTSNIVIYNK